MSICLHKCQPTAKYIRIIGLQTESYICVKITVYWYKQGKININNKKCRLSIDNYYICIVHNRPKNSHGSDGVELVRWRDLLIVLSEVSSFSIYTYIYVTTFRTTELLTIQISPQPHAILFG